MSKTFVCADLHFNHHNIIALANRPFGNAYEMNRTLIGNWNKVVRSSDKVFVLGDVSFCSRVKAGELIRQLKGYKTLVMGNHDRVRSPAKWMELGFDVVSPHPILYKEFVMMSHEPLPNMCEKDGIFYIYGHVHNSPDYPNWTEHCACVSMERIGYAPVLLEDVMSGVVYK